MPRMARWEARNLEIVSEHRLGIPIRGRGLPVHPVRLLEGRMLKAGEGTDTGAGEELLLVVIARAPVENAAHIDRLTAHVANDRLGRDTLRRKTVVRAPGRVNVHVAGVIRIIRRSHPSDQRRLERAGSIGHDKLNLLFEVLRSACDGRRVGAGRQEDHLPGGAVNVIVKKHVGGDAHFARWEDAARTILDRQSERARRAIGIAHLERDGDRRTRLELKRRALMPDVKAEKPVARADGEVGVRGALIPSEDCN